MLANSTQELLTGEHVRTVVGNRQQDANEGEDKHLGRDDEDQV